MTSLLAPSNLQELAECVRTTAHLIAVGGQTKPRLTQVDKQFTPISTLRLHGILEYEPDEFTITALAGTTVSEIENELAKNGQYLPFEPLFRDAGSTLGGTVAAGTNGPGRLRYGGVRDFILGVRYVDGNGRLLRMGGKVVKNAAGFDLPKFFVGSLGRFGIMGEITLKVFPRPRSSLTLRLPFARIDEAAQLLASVAAGRWQPDALDTFPGSKVVVLRLCGPASALPDLAREILARWPGEQLSEADAVRVWTELRETQWVYLDGVLLKIPLTLTALPAIFGLVHDLHGGRLHISGGGNVGYLSVPSVEQIGIVDEQLRRLNLCALTLRGPCALLLGTRADTSIETRVKEALDPQHRFPSLHH
jgi:glycolate oxidase FAD binding subunit